MNEQQRVDAFLVDPEQKVLMEKRIWGFIIHLKQEAVDNLENMLQVLETALEYGIKPGAFRTAICDCIKLKQLRLKAVTNKNGPGCRLVSPWPIPFALTVMKEKKPSDQHLYFSVFNPQDNTWSEEADFSGDGEDDENDVQSASGPALAEFDGKLFCVHRGKDNDTHLYWETYTTNTGWSDPQQFPTNHQTYTMPALVVFQGQLYCFYLLKDTTTIHSCRLNPSSNTWTEYNNIPAHGANAGPAVAVMNEKLYLGHWGDKNFMYIAGCTSTNAWTNWNGMNGAKTTDAFNFVAYKNKLHTFVKGTDKQLYHLCGNSEVESTWYSEHVPPIATMQGPAACFFETPGVSGGHVYMVHRGGNDKSSGKLYWNRYSNFTHEDLSVIPKDFSSGDDQHCTADNPALAVYHDTQGADPSQGYQDSANAGPRLICVYRGRGG
ncbi:MAG: hypothetical protein AN485_19860 [Anabaena sp. MDT14b]|jgi:hypothetical protein|nr:MAG: hypothetical protein AN485_19860 [Anabaena sp. MDT14b]